jgi:hypothetical protein
METPAVHQRDQRRFVVALLWDVVRIAVGLSAVLWLDRPTELGSVGEWLSFILIPVGYVVMVDGLGGTIADVLLHRAGPLIIDERGVINGGSFRRGTRFSWSSMLEIRIRNRRRWFGTVVFERRNRWPRPLKLRRFVDPDHLVDDLIRQSPVPVKVGRGWGLGRRSNDAASGPSKRAG